MEMLNYFTKEVRLKKLISILKTQKYDFLSDISYVLIYTTECVNEISERDAREFLIAYGVFGALEQVKNGLYIHSANGYMVQVDHLVEPKRLFKKLHELLWYDIFACLRAEFREVWNTPLSTKINGIPFNDEIIAYLNDML